MSFAKKFTKLAMIPLGVVLTVGKEIHEELREKTPDEMRQKAEDEYLRKVSEIEVNEEIVKLEKELARLQGTEGKTGKERKLAQLRREVAEAKAQEKK